MTPAPAATRLWAAALASLSLGLAAPLTAHAQPVKVQLPANQPPKPRTGPTPLDPADARGGPDRRAIQSRGLYQLDFDKVDIDKLVQTISDMTGRLFILPENIRGKITIIGPEHGKAGVTADEAYAAFLAALDANGLTVYQVGKYWKIVDKRSGKQSNIPTYVDEDAAYTTNEQMVTKLFRLRYVEVEPVRAVVQQLVSKDGDTLSFPPDVLIINDVGLNMHRLEKIIEKLDATSSNDQMRVIQVQYGTASEMAEKLRQIFEDKNKKPGQRSGASIAAPPMTAPQTANPPSPTAGGGGGEEGTASLSQIIPDDRTNKLIVIANEKAFQRIMDVLGHLDTPVPGEGQVHVYYLENANAEEMASTLAALTQGINKGPRPPVPAPGAARGPATVADLFSGEVKITADKGTNSLVVIASSNDYRNLVKVIEKLDIARRQVFVEAVIMEVNLKNALSLGFSMHGGSPASVKDPDDSLFVTGSELGTANSLSGILSLASLGGFLAGLQGPVISEKFPIPAFSIVMHALQNSSDVNVLSTPHILTSDNEDAEITVGQNVPFQAGVATGLGNLGALGGSLGTGAAGTSALASSALLGGLGSFIAPIQRQNVELKLKIKPQINESDYIRLQIEEQTEEIAEQDQRLGPTTSKRSAKTTVVAKDQQTVVIGGLIQERTVRGVQKVPLLGDIPVLGWLFRDTSNTKIKTNLLLFLTPYIIRDQKDFQRIFERKMKERQEFVEQFYGRQPGYNVVVDYDRKAGPMAKMLRSLNEEDMKIENGGPGAGGEKAITPSSNAAPQEPRGGDEGVKSQSIGGADSSGGKAVTVPLEGEQPGKKPSDEVIKPQVREPAQPRPAGPTPEPGNE